ncbi:hypothetical protein ILUMI_25740, partial [Ignelater luminosus]
SKRNDKCQKQKDLKWYQEHPVSQNTEKLKETKEQNLRTINSQEGDENIDLVNANIVNTIKEAEKTCSTKQDKYKNKLIEETKELMKERRNMKEKSDANQTQLRNINKEISKTIRTDVRKYNTKEIKRVIKENKEMKILRKTMFEGQKDINRLTKRIGQLTTNKTEIFNTVENFYAELYTEKAENEDTDIPEIKTQGSEDTPCITMQELQTAFKEMNKSPGHDEIIIEAIKTGEPLLIQEICNLFNLCLQKGITSSQWNRAVIISIDKKGDSTNLGNYRAISLLSQVYNLFMKIITERLKNKLDFYQHKEQEGFRSGCGINNHLQ